MQAILSGPGSISPVVAAVLVTLSIVSVRLVSLHEASSGAHMQLAGSPMHNNTPEVLGHVKTLAIVVCPVMTAADQAFRTPA